MRLGLALTAIDGCLSGIQMPTSTSAIPWTSFCDVARRYFQQAQQVTDLDHTSLEGQRIAELDAAHRRGPSGSGDALMNMWMD